MRVQCDHVNVDKIKLFNPGKPELDDGKLSLSDAPDRSIVIGNNTVIFTLCPACKDTIKAEVAKWT